MGLLCTFESVGSRWLGPSLGCCASRRDCEDDDEEYRDIADPLQFEPTSIEKPQHAYLKQEESYSRRPSTSHTASLSQWVTEGRSMIVRMSTQASNTTRSWYAQSNRPSIGQPLDFRRVDGVNVPQRDSFRPLELSICLPDGRLSPLPDFSGDVHDTGTGLQMPQKALVRSRADSVLSTGGSSHFTIQRKPVSSACMQEDGQSVRSSVICGPTETETKSRDALHNRSASVQSSPAPYGSRSYSPHRLSSTGSRTTSGFNRPRACTEPRRAKMDVEEAISELNTIVEERRADALRNSGGSVRRSSTTEHIPAIAPGMKVHARSETLSEIGSAFSLPLAMKPLPAVPQSSSRMTSATYTEDDSLPSKKPIEPKVVLDWRPKSAPAQHDRSAKPKPKIAVSVRAMCEEIESTKLPQIPLKTGTSTPLSAQSVGSASLSQRLNMWLRRSLPSSPTTPTTNMAFSDGTSDTNTPTKSVFVTNTMILPSIPPPPSSSPPPLPATPPRQPAMTTTANANASPRTNNTTFFSSSTFSSPSARSTPSLVSSASSFSTLTAGASSKFGTEVVAEAEAINDSHVKTRSASRTGSDITSASDLDMEGEYSSLPSRRSVKRVPVRRLALTPAPAPVFMPVPMQVESTLSSLMSPPACQETDQHSNTPVTPVVGLAL